MSVSGQHVADMSVTYPTKLWITVELLSVMIFEEKNIVTEKKN